jgi:glyoxylase-like metal-dependent hydrolase (beta-lactamase superfamily II)
MRNNVVVLSGEEGAVVVDTGFSARAVPELRTLVAGWSPAGIRWVINTHAHGDHVAGNALAPSPGAVVTAASLGAASGPPVARDPEPLVGRSGRTLPAPWSLRVGGREIKLVPRPGLHSDADLIAYFPSESVVAMGDLLLSESVPAVDDLPGYLAFLDDVLDVFPEGTTFVSGHGRELDAAGVRAYRADLVAMVDVVRAGLASGRTAEQMVRDDVLAAYEPRYSLLGFLTPDALVPRAVAAVREKTSK